MSASPFDSAIYRDLFHDHELASLFTDEAEIRAMLLVEGELALAQTVLHLATAPKSNAAYAAFGEALRAARETGSLAPPMHSLNAPTRLMKDLGYGEGYAYDHDAPAAFAGRNYFPDGMARRQFYRPDGRGAEAEIAERLAAWAGRRQA